MPNTSINFRSVILTILCLSAPSLKAGVASAAQPMERVAQLEREGKPYLALKTCAQALSGQAKPASLRQQLKGKAIGLGAGLNPGPVVPLAVKFLMDRGYKKISEGSFQDAVELYEQASCAAPWWAEPYYSLGLLFEHLTDQKGNRYADRAIENLALFQKAAGKSDSRVKDVENRIERLRKLRE